MTEKPRTFGLLPSPTFTTVEVTSTRDTTQRTPNHVAKTRLVFRVQSRTQSDDSWIAVHKTLFSWQAITRTEFRNQTAETSTRNSDSNGPSPNHHHHRRHHQWIFPPARFFLPQLHFVSTMAGRPSNGPPIRDDNDNGNGSRHLVKPISFVLVVTTDFLSHTHISTSLSLSLSFVSS